MSNDNSNSSKRSTDSKSSIDKKESIDSTEKDDEHTFKKKIHNEFRTIYKEIYKKIKEMGNSLHINNNTMEKKNIEYFQRKYLNNLGRNFGDRVENLTKA